VGESETFSIQHLFDAQSTHRITARDRYYPYGDGLATGTHDRVRNKAME